MKITKRHNDGTVRFESLFQGATFLDSNTYYMKTESILNNECYECNAVNLENGDLIHFENDDRVKYVEAELICDV